MLKQSTILSLHYVRMTRCIINKWHYVSAELLPKTRKDSDDC
jgi:hypothetical protein